MQNNVRKWSNMSVCLFVNSGVQHILCCGFCFVFLRRVSCVPNVASFSGLPILCLPLQYSLTFIDHLVSLH